MDDYVVGSVADLISNKTSKVKLKKKKLKTTKTSVDTSTEKDQSLSNNTDSKEIKETRNVKENVTVKTSKRKKGTEPQVEGESLKKKRKKLPKPVAQSNSVEPNNVLQSQKLKTQLANSQSYDSKENEVENTEKRINNKKFSKKSMSIEDFTENTVFVGNIPISYDRKKISKLFSKFGEIITTRIRCVPIAEINMNKKVAAIKKQYHPKRNSLVAYVKFKTLDSANAALEANGMVVDDHHLRVDTAQSTKERDNSKAVFVGGLPFDIEDDELWEFFKNCGQIESVRVIRDSQTSMGKGFGYVNFDSTASVELALQLDGQELKNRKINVKRCVKYRNKNKSNTFGAKKSKEITNKLLCKKGKKFKEEKKKLKKEKLINFQGRTANMKHKKKKKLSQAALHQRKLVKILGAS